MRKCRRPNPRCESGQAIRMAASDPTVPGALGEKPHPNHVAKAQAGLFVIGFAVRRWPGGGGDNVLFHGPVAQIDLAAAPAAKRNLLVCKLHWFLTDRTRYGFRRRAHLAGIWFGITKPVPDAKDGPAAIFTRTCEVGRNGVASGSVETSSVPMRS